MSLWLAAEPEPADVEVTRTPLGAAADPAMLEEQHRPIGRVKQCRVRKTQSVGGEQVTVVLDNEAGRADAWTSGDALKVRARPRTGDWVTLAEGLIGGPQYDVDQDNPVVTVPFYGGIVLLDLATVAKDKEYVDEEFTDIVNDVMTTYQPGVTLVITSDATKVANFRIVKGQKVRDVVDYCRRALTALTGQHWEYTYAISGATKTFTFFKRDTTSQRTIKRWELQKGSQRVKGDVLEVVNVARVLGAVVPGKTLTSDKGQAVYRKERFTATTVRYAHRFRAPDSPLFSVSARLDRSVFSDPPTLAGFVARNARKFDDVQDGFTRGKSFLYTFHSSFNPAAFFRACDADSTVKFASGNTAAGVKTEMVRIDLGAPVPTVAGINYKFDVEGTGTHDWSVEHSDDGAAWTVGDSQAGIGNGTINRVFMLANRATKRYWRITHTSSGGGGNIAVYEFNVLNWKNLSTDATNPNNVMDVDAATPTTSSDVSVVGAGDVKELARFDLETPTAIAKWELTHSESVANSLLVVVLQKSHDNTTWEDVAQLASSVSTVKHTIFTEDNPARYWRVIAKDDRATHGADTQKLYRVRMFPHELTTVLAPLVDGSTVDTMKGSDQAFDVTSLVKPHPGLLSKATYPAPSLALVPVVGTHGTSTGSNALLTLNDTGKAWTVDQWKAYIVEIVLGTGVGQTRLVVSNTATRLTVSEPWETTPDATSVYQVYRYDSPYWLVWKLASAGSATSWWEWDIAKGSLDWSNLALYLAFEDADFTSSLATVRDGSLNANHGTLTNPGTGSRKAEGRLGGGIVFGATTSVNDQPYVSVPDHADLDFTNALTIAAWVRPRDASLAHLQTIANKRNANANGYNFYITTAGNLEFVFIKSGPTVVTSTSTGATSDNAWTHVAVTYDGANVRFYVNGALDSTVAQTGDILVNTFDFKVGSADLDDTELVGVIDELYAFKRKLSDTEITSLFNLAEADWALFQSDDSGTNFFPRPPGVTLRVVLEFNEHQLVGVASDAASQTKYAGLVPNGIISGGHVDDALTTQEMVDNEALNLVNRRGDVRDRAVIVLPFDAGLVTGKRVTLDAEAAGVLGFTAAAKQMDVTELEHALGEKSTTTLFLDEHPADADSVLAYGLGVTGSRRF